MHIQIAREYFETHFHNRSADFSLNGDFYERVVQRQDLEVEWSEKKCKIKSHYELFQPHHVTKKAQN